MTAAGGREQIMMLQGRSRELKTQLFNLNSEIRKLERERKERKERRKQLQ